MRRSVGDAAGLTIKGQVRQAARNLGYPDGDWRPRECWYGRAGRWSATALDDLRRRYAAWRGRERAVGREILDEKLAAVRDGLAELQRQFGKLEEEVGRVLGDKEGEKHA